MDILQFENRDLLNYKYVLVVIDNFSRFTHLRPLRTQDGDDCRTALNTIFCHWGAPSRIRCDHGSQLRAQKTKDLLIAWGIEFADSPAYSSQSHGLVERVNRSVRELMGTIVFESDKKIPWSKHIPMIQYQINSRLHSKTAFAPADLLLGKANALCSGPLRAEINKAKSAPDQVAMVFSMTTRSDKSAELYSPPDDMRPKDARAQLRYLNRASGHKSGRDLVEEARIMEGLRRWLRARGEPLWQIDSESDDSDDEVKDLSDGRQGIGQGRGDGLPSTPGDGLRETLLAGGDGLTSHPVDGLRDTPTRSDDGQPLPLGARSEAREGSRPARKPTENGSESRASAASSSSQTDFTAAAPASL